MTVSATEGRHGRQDNAVSVAGGAECRRQRIIHPFLPSLCRDATHVSSLHAKYPRRVATRRAKHNVSTARSFVRSLISQPESRALEPGVSNVCWIYVGVRVGVSKGKFVRTRKRARNVFSASQGS